MRGVVLGVAQLRRDDQLAHAALRHPEDPLLNRLDDASRADLEPEEFLVYLIELLQLLCFEWPPEVADGIAGPVDHNLPRQGTGRQAGTAASSLVV